MEPLEGINSLQLTLVKHWHCNPPVLTRTGLLGLVEKQHLQNFLLWHEEDIARAPDVDNAEIARVKRSIDKLNQERNDLIEGLDLAILEMLQAKGFEMLPHVPMNSETPGSIIDRCSIMALKIYHMKEQTTRPDVDESHREEASRKAKLLEMQREDLFVCLIELMDDITNGLRRFKLYRQFKMYNDPTLNPRIYSATSN